MKVEIYIDEDEWYPVFDARLARSWQGQREAWLSDEDWTAYQAAVTEFQKWQDRLKKAFNEHEFYV